MGRKPGDLSPQHRHIKHTESQTVKENLTCFWLHLVENPAANGLCKIRQEIAGFFLPFSCVAFNLMQQVQQSNISSKITNLNKYTGNVQLYHHMSS